MYKRQVSYCATCDGMLYRDRDVAVWGLGPNAPEEADFLASIGCRVHYIAAKKPPHLADGIPFLEGRLEAVEGSQTVERVRVGGSIVPVTGVFILRASVPAGALVPGLPLTEDGYVCVDRRQCTEIPGLFAAGDMAGQPLQVAKACLLYTSLPEADSPASSLPEAAPPQATMLNAIESASTNARNFFITISSSNKFHIITFK